MNRFLSAVLVSWLLAAREPSLRTGIEAEAAVLLELWENRRTQFQVSRLVSLNYAVARPPDPLRNELEIC